MFQGIFKSAINEANKNYIFGTGSIPINIKVANLETFANSSNKQQGYEVAEVNKLISTMLTGWDANGNKPKSMSDNYLELILSCDNGFVVKKRLQFPHIIAWQNDSTPYNIADVYKEFSIDNWLKADDFENPDITLAVEPTDEILTTSTATPPEATTTNSGRFYLYYRNLPVGVNRIHIYFHIKTKTEPIDFDLEVVDGLSWKDAQTILASNEQAKINVLLSGVKDVYNFTGAEGNFDEITMHEWSELYQQIISLNPNNKFTHDLFFIIYYDNKDLSVIQTQVNTNTEQIQALSEEIIENKSYPLSESGYVSWLYGYISATENAQNTGMIPIVMRGILQYRVFLSDVGAAVAFYDENKNYLQAISVRGNGLMQGEIDLTDSAYDNAKYFTLSYYDGSHEYALYICELVFSDNTIGNRIAALENNPTIAKKSMNILIFGDSITDTATITIVNDKTSYYSVNPSYQNSYVNEQGQTIRYCMWPFLITKYFKTFDVRNYAQTGASYKDQNDSSYPRKSLSYQIQLAINDIPNENNAFPTNGDYVPDIIIFALGTNDGKPNDTFQDAMNKTIMDGNNFDFDATIANLDRSKFCEAARYAFLKIKQQFPNALCICILPIQRVSIDIQQDGVNNELRKMAERYSMIVLDGASDSGIVRDIEESDTLGVNLKDGLHPNDKGQNMMTRMIVNTIKNNWVDNNLMNL